MNSDRINWHRVFRVDHDDWYPNNGSTDNRKFVQIDRMIE